MLIDAHTHLDHYDQTIWPKVLAEISRYNVLCISNATDLVSYTQTREIAKSNALILPTFGIHPWYAVENAHLLETDRTALDAAITQSPMLGEIGLDQRWIEDAATYPIQQHVFEYFLAAARVQDKSVNLHTSGAEALVLQLLEAYDIAHAIVHWYAGPLDVLHRMIQRGIYFTIGVEVMHSAQIQTIARAIPMALLLTETDGPSGLDWLTGEIGMPHHLEDVLATLAKLKGVSIETMKATVAENFWCFVHDDPWLASHTQSVTI